MTLSFFRRHRKWFMVLMFAALIAMIFFGSWSVMGPKIEDWFGLGGRNPRVGTIDGRPVRADQAREFEYALRTAGEVSHRWAVMLVQDAGDVGDEVRQRAWGYTMGLTAWPLLAPMIKSGQERPDVQTVLVWMALYEEARRAGFNVTAVEVESRIKDLRELGLTPEAVKQTIDRYAGGQHSQLVDMMRKDMTLRAYFNWLGDILAGAVDPEMRHEFIQMDERLKVRLAVLRAEDFVAEVKDVPEATLQQQFNKYKKFLAGQSPDKKSLALYSPEGYGYRIPDRVAIEYLVADPAGFEAAARPKVTDDDVRKYYDLRKDPEFLVKEEKKDEAKKEDAKAAAAKDEAKPPEKKFRPFEEVRDEIRKNLVRREASDQARKLLREDVVEIRTNNKPPDLRIWADGNQVKHVTDPALRTAEQLAELKPIGQAVRGVEGLPEGTEGLPQCALSVTELAGAAKAKLSVMEISEVFIGPEGEAYAFRVTRVDAHHEPASLAEVRSKVLADVRKAKAFEIARERGKGLMEAAAAKGLEAAAKEAKVKVVESEWFPREHLFPYGGQWVTIPPALPEVGSNRLVVAECFQMAAEGRQRTLVTQADAQMVVVAELVERKVPRQAAYDRLRPLIEQRVGRQVARGAMLQALNKDSIQRRMKVVVEVPEGVRTSREAPVEDDGG